MPSHAYQPCDPTSRGHAYTPHYTGRLRDLGFEVTHLDVDKTVTHVADLGTAVTHGDLEPAVTHVVDSGTTVDKTATHEVDCGTTVTQGDLELSVTHVVDVNKTGEYAVDLDTQATLRDTTTRCGSRTRWTTTRRS